MKFPLTRKHKVLAAVLGVQLVLVIFVFLRPGELKPFQSGEKLIKLDWDKIAEIKIHKMGDEAAVIKKEGGVWTLPEVDSFEADPEKVKDFINTLSGLTLSWPSGATKVAAKQFKVVEKDFERRIDLAFEGGSVATLYLGTSPGFKKVHGRIEGEDQTYVVDMSVHEVGPNARDWINRNYHEVAREDVLSIKLKDLVLESHENEFRLPDVPEGKEMKGGEVNQLVNTALKIPFDEVLGREEKKEFGLKNPTFQYTVATKGGETVDYILGGPYEKEFHVLKISRSPYFFKVKEKDIKKLKEAKRDDLLQEAKKPGEPGETTEILEEYK